MDGTVPLRATRLPGHGTTPQLGPPLRVADLGSDVGFAVRNTPTESLVVFNLDEHLALIPEARNLMPSSPPLGTRRMPLEHG